jgi:hypothetical protein
VVRSRVEQGPALIARLSLVAALALLAASCGGGEQHAPIPPLEPAKVKKVPPSHHTALAYVKRCEAALARLPIEAVPFTRARAVAAELTKAIADCGESDALNTLVNRNRADSSVDEAYLGEIAVAYGLGNYAKYVRAVVAKKHGPTNVLGLAQEQIRVGKQRLDAAVTELPYPP